MLIVAAALLLLVTACRGNGSDDGLPPVSGTQIPSVVLAARDHLAQRLNVRADSIQIRTIQDREWADACLGYARAGEACAQVITPGYRAVFASGGQTYEYRTDLTRNFRAAP
jgi:hypothetical protein